MLSFSIVECEPAATIARNEGLVRAAAGRDLLMPRSYGRTGVGDEGDDASGASHTRWERRERNAVLLHISGGIEDRRGDDNLP